MARRITMSALLPIITESAADPLSFAVIMFLAGIAGATFGMALTSVYRLLSKLPVAGIALAALILFVSLLISHSLRPDSMLPFRVHEPVVATYFSLILLLLSILSYFAYKRSKGILADGILDGMIITASVSIPAVAVYILLVVEKGSESVDPAIFASAYSVGVAAIIVPLRIYLAKKQPVSENIKISTLWWATSAAYFIFALMSFLIQTSRPGIPAEQYGELTVYRDTHEAYTKARQTKKPVFIDFYADWCAPCREFSSRLKADTELQNRLDRFVVLKITEKDMDFQKYENSPGYESLEIGLPLFVLTSPTASIYATASGLDELEVLLDQRAPVE